MLLALLHREEQKVGHVVDDPLWQGREDPGHQLRVQRQHHQRPRGLKPQRVGLRVHLALHRDQEELRDGREELKATLEEVRVQQAGVGAGLRFAQFLEERKMKLIV